MKTRTLTVSNNRATIEVFEAGSGPDLVYLHGAGGIMPDDPFIAALAKDFRVQAPLLPGYGKSEGGEHFRDMLDFTLLGLDILDALGVKNPLLVGHSMGGMIAAEMAALAPQLIHRLVLIAPAGLWLEDHPIPDLFAMMPYDFPPLLFHDEKLGEKIFTAGLDLDNVEFLTNFLVMNSRQMGFAGKILFPIPERGLSERLFRIRAKTLLLWGADDKLIPLPYAKAFRKHLPKADYVEIPAAGHLPTLEKPAETVAAIRHWAKEVAPA